MVSPEELKVMIGDLESDRIERTTSTNNTDNFAQAVCAFANDLANHRAPGFLIVGINEEGIPSELLANAIMHRNYDSNTPIRFYWFADRLEIQSPGGLYGEVTPQNYLTHNSYRNPIIAEAMKALGYVNRFGYGISRAQRLLDENGNPAAEFAFAPNSVGVTVRRRSD